MNGNTPIRSKPGKDGVDVADGDRRDRSVPETVYIAACLLCLVALAVVWLA